MWECEPKPTAERLVKNPCPHPLTGHTGVMHGSVRAPSPKLLIYGAQKSPSDDVVSFTQKQHGGCLLLYYGCPII